MATVMIGCKLPHGIILEILKPGEGLHPAPQADAKRVELKGANSLRRRADEPSMGILPYAITPVDEAFWKEWLKANKDLAFVKNGMVFEAKDVPTAKAMAQERTTGVKTGLEALAHDGNDERLKSHAQRVTGDPDALKRIAEAQEAA